MHPGISCVMVTRDRAHFVPGAIADFLSQDYAEKELIVVDDGTDAIGRLVPDHPAIRYLRLPEARAIGAKRNLACSFARGDIITHWDDDDFSAPERLSVTVAAFADPRIEVVGLESALYADLASGRAYRFSQPDCERSWLPMLSYRHRFWRREPFPDVNLGEDNRLFRRALREQVALIRGRDLQVFAIHHANVAAKQTEGTFWHPVDTMEVERAVADPARLASWGRAPAQPPRAPRISVIFPAHREGAPLVGRAVHALRAQTLPFADFEVVVGADGDEAYEAVCAEVRADSQPFTCTVVRSPRPRGHVSHRNHARNAACRVARGEWVWVLDGDSLIEPCALAHFVHEMEEAPPGQLRILSPTLMGISCTPEEWVERSGQLIERGDFQALASARDFPQLGWFYSGFEDRYEPGAPLSEPCPQMLEGYPAMARTLWEAVGRFDEFFVGWGGEKEDLVRKLLRLGLELPIEMRLVRSVRVLHQPHHRDPAATPGHPESTANAQLFAARQEGVHLEVPWWRRIKRRVATLCATLSRELPSAAHLTHPRAEGPRVGIVSGADRAGGLLRDAEILRATYDDPRRTSVFAVHALSHQRALGLEACAAELDGGDETLAVAGTLLRSFCERIDVLVLLEVFSAEVVDYARALDKRVVYVPNVELADGQGELSAWVAALFDRPWVDVWAKTARTAAALKAVGITAWTIPWCVPDTVARERSPRAPGPIRLLVNAGRGGARDLRGIDLALRAFARARERVADLTLTLKSCGPLTRVADAELLAQPGLVQVTEFLSRSQLDALYADADALLVTSRAEGLGLPILEAAHRGLPVLATDGWPMNELVEHEHDALLVRATTQGFAGLSPRWEVDVDAMANAIVRFATDAVLRARLTCPQPGSRVAAQHAFTEHVRARLRGESLPRVVVLYEGLRGHRRDGEWFWAEGLRNHGYDVEFLSFLRGMDDIRAALSATHAFVLVANAPVHTLREIRRATSAPVVLWHHDYMDMFPERRAWFDAAGSIVDMALLPDAVQRPCQAEQHTLLPGAMITGDRGPGRRPRTLPSADSGPPAVFIGSALGIDPRADVVRALWLRAGLEIYGDADSWARWGLPCRGPLRGEDADAMHRKAQIALSISRASGTPSYTSDRLFNAAAMGACLLVEDFPGLSELFPVGAIARFVGNDSACEVVDQLERDPARRDAMRACVVDHCWRHHTVEDRIAVMLYWLERWLDESVVRAEPVVPSRQEDTARTSTAELAAWSRRRVAVGRRHRGAPQVSRFDPG